MNTNQIAPGDECRYEDGRLAYTVLEVLSRTDKEVRLKVQWVDGGVEPRIFDADDEVPSITRPLASTDGGR